MKLTKIFFTIILLSTLTAAGCKSVQAVNAAEITISAAASLRDPLSEIIAQYEKETNIKVNINLGSSGSLQKQIEEGAPVDIFISAGKTQVDALTAKGLIDKYTYKNLLTNSLVLIVSNSYDKNIISIEELKNKNIKLALGEASTVPVGQYSKEFLENIKLWENFKDKIVFSKDVKAVLNYVEKGEAEAGIVYISDTVNLKNSYVAYKIPQNTHEPIVYPAVIIGQSKNKAFAKAFMEFMGKPQAKEIFKKYNFDVKDN